MFSEKDIIIEILSKKNEELSGDELRKKITYLKCERNKYLASGL